MAVVYTDFFRGVPGVLIIYILGFGIPALGVDWVPSDPFFWGVVALVARVRARTCRRCTGRGSSPSTRARRPPPDPSA